MQHVIQLLLVLLLVLLNGYFVASEFALVAIRKTRIDELARKGSKSARLVQTALNDLESYISATQLGITLASLGLGWVGEPVIARMLEPLFYSMPKNLGFFTSHSLALIISFSVITFLHIVLGELAPKTIALQRTEKTSLFIIAPLILFAKTFSPFIWLLNNTGHFVVKLFGFKGDTKQQIAHSEDEIKLLLSESQLGGILEKNEVDMVNQVLRFTDIPVEQIMIPRTEIIAFNGNLTLKQIVNALKSNVHSRFPVYEKSVDRIIGFVHIKDIYKSLIQFGDEIKLHNTKIIREIISVPESKPADEVLLDMRRKRIHIAVINDEYGGTAGIVTLEDIVESIIGEIEDEFDLPSKDIQREKDGSYIVNGLLPIEILKQNIDIPLKGQGYTTIGGVVFGLLGRPAKKGDIIQLGNVIFEIIEVEGRRIKTLRLKKEDRKKNRK